MPSPLPTPDLRLSLPSITPLLTALQTVTPEKSQEVCLTPDGPNLRLSTTHSLLHASTILPSTLFTQISQSPTLHASVNHSLLLDTLSTLPPTPVVITLNDGIITATASDHGETRATVHTNDTPAVEVPRFEAVQCSGYAPCAGLRDAVGEVEYCGASEALVTMNEELVMESHVGEAGVRVVVDGFEGSGHGTGWFKVAVLARVAKALSDGGSCRVAIDDGGALKVVAEVGEGVAEFVVVGVHIATNAISSHHRHYQNNHLPHQSTTITAHSAGAKPLLVPVTVVCYALSSLGGVFVNKACLSHFTFGYTVTLMLLQLTASTLSLTLLRLTPLLTIPPRSPADLTTLAFPATFFITNVTVGLLALKLVNIPMFSAFRRLSVLSVMLLEYIILGKTASNNVLVTVSIMVFGSFLAGLGDLAFDPLGYALVFLNNFITAANLVSIKKASQKLKLDALSLFYYVSLLSLLPVLLLSILSGELPRAVHDVATRKDLQTLQFLFALSASAASAFLINFFTNLCTQLTSPLTTAITGQMKNVLQTILGIFAFGYRVTTLNLFGLGIALLGSLGFARVKWTEGKRKEATERQEEAALLVKKDIG